MPVILDLGFGCVLARCLRRCSGLRAVREVLSDAVIADDYNERNSQFTGQLDIVTVGTK
jgi:hypothetical protein